MRSVRWGFDHTAGHGDLPAAAPAADRFTLVEKTPQNHRSRQFVLNTRQEIVDLKPLEAEIYNATCRRAARMLNAPDDDPKEARKRLFKLYTLLRQSALHFLLIARRIETIDEIDDIESKILRMSVNSQNVDVLGVKALLQETNNLFPELPDPAKDLAAVAAILAGDIGYQPPEDRRSNEDDSGAHGEEDGQEESEARVGNDPVEDKQQTNNLPLVKKRFDALREQDVLPESATVGAVLQQIGAWLKEDKT